MKNYNMNIYEIFAKEVVKDYFTANIKAEVIFDTILTPIIGEILTIVYSGKSDKEMRLIAKEFPILKEKGRYCSWNVDYLMCDDKTVYLVELKTTKGSAGEEQWKRYRNHIGNYHDEFALREGYDFVRLLNHVSKTGVPDKEFEDDNKQKSCGKDWISELKSLFEEIINHSSNDSPEMKTGKYTERAQEYLKRNKANSSKKYLTTAGQVLDHIDDDCEWWNYTKRKVIYLVPANEPNKLGKCDKDDIIDIVTFEDIIGNKDNIGKEIKKGNLVPIEYWEWVVGILESVFK